jgi:hypothetical protein
MDEQVSLPTEGESDFIAPSSARAFQEAETHDLIIITPGTHDLQIDIDDAAGFEEYSRNREIVGKYWGIAQERVAPSKGGKEWRKHITLTLKVPVTPTERVALQACLGSDRKRELLSLQQVKVNDPHPTLFLEKK